MSGTIDFPPERELAAQLARQAPEGVEPLVIMYVTGWIYACLEGAWGDGLREIAEDWARTLRVRPKQAAPPGGGTDVSLSFNVAKLLEDPEALEVFCKEYADEGLRERVVDLTARVAVLEEALKQLPHRRDCTINPGGKTMEALGDPTPRPCSCGRDAALSSSPPTPGSAWRAMEEVIEGLLVNRHKRRVHPGEPAYDLGFFTPVEIERARAGAGCGEAGDGAVPGGRAVTQLWPEPVRPYFANYSQHGADTGRWSGDFQQTPRVVEGEPNIRNCVAAPEGQWLLEADYSMLELRFIAWRAREETMLRFLRDGKDLHAHSGRMLFGIPDGQPAPKITRQTGKTCNFGLGYEASDDKLAEIMLLNLKDADIQRIKELLGVTTLGECASILHPRWHDTYPGIRVWHNREKILIAKQGKAIAPHGREKHLPLSRSKNFKDRSDAFREGINHVIQSPASELTVLAATIATPRLYAEHNAIGGPWLNHDALLYLMGETSYSAAGQCLKQAMEVDAVRVFNGMLTLDIDIPIVAELKCGTRWGSLTELLV